MTEQLLERTRHHGNKLLPKHEGNIQLPKDHAALTKDKKEKTSKTKETNTVGGFGGLRKGFLFGSAPESATPSTEVKVQSSSAKTPKGQSAAVDDVIRPKQQTSNLEFPEVQESMKQSFPFLNTQS